MLSGEDFVIKNIFISLNGWQRIFVVLVIFVQTPLTALFVYSQSSGHIEIEELNALANELYEQKKIPTKARIYSFSEGEKINITSLKLADLDYDVSDIPLVNKGETFKFNVFEARKVGYSDTEIIEFLADKWKININKARKSGLSDTMILNNLIANSESDKKFKIINIEYKYQYDVLIDERSTNEQETLVKNKLADEIEKKYRIRNAIDVIETLISSLVISILIYSLGFAMGWVIRGFKQSKV